MPEDHLIEVESIEDAALLAINRPNSFNSFTLDMIQTLARHLTCLALHPQVRGIVLTGRGKAFCAGGDLRWIAEHPSGRPQAFHELAAYFHQAVLEIKRMPKPVIAAVNGLAAGGGFSLALACDFRILEKKAILRQAYTSNGLSMDGGATYSLPRIVGTAKALEIAAFDRPIPAEKALEWGLATEVVEDGCSVERALAVLNTISRSSLPSFAASKKLIADSFHNAFEAQLEAERQALAHCSSTREGEEGIAAFLQKRKPIFKQG